MRMTFIPAGWMVAARIVEPCLRGTWKKVVRKMRAFFPHLKLVRSFATARTEAALRGTPIACPEFRQYFPTLLRYCLATNWGEGSRQAAPAPLVSARQSQQA
jgi:hypothetical protein